MDNKQALMETGTETLLQVLAIDNLGVVQVVQLIRQDQDFRNIRLVKYCRTPNLN